MLETIPAPTYLISFLVILFTLLTPIFYLFRMALDWAKKWEHGEVVDYLESFM